MPERSPEHSLREARTRHDNYLGVQHLTLALVTMNPKALPPILLALGASQATLRAPSSTATGRPADAAKS